MKPPVKTFLFGLLAFPLTVLSQTSTATTAIGNLKRPPSGDTSKVTLIVRMNAKIVSLRGSLVLDALLHNGGDETAYVDRRLFWGVHPGGLLVQVRDEAGRSVPSRFQHAAIMPPPNPSDLSVLSRLDPGFLYGVGLRTPAITLFPKGGKYSLRVVYQSWLAKESVSESLQDLPAIWAGAPAIASDWIPVKVSP